MDCIITTFGAPHEFSGPTGGADMRFSAFADRIRQTRYHLRVNLTGP